MKFTPITPADRGHLLKYFDKQEYPLSSYSLPGILVWNNCAFNNYYNKNEDMLLVSESHIANPKARWLLMPLGMEVPPDQLAVLAKKSGHSIYRYVPQEYVDRYGEAAVAASFAISRELEYDDYIYKRSDLAGLKGAKFHKKRNLIAQFERDVKASTPVEVEMMSAETARQAREFVDRWYQARREKYSFWTDELGCERQALLQTLDNFVLVGAQGLVVRIGGKIEGLGIASQLTDEMSVLNFEKANEEYHGLYQFLDRECAVRLFPERAFINKESDLGDEGLRHAKESYHPVKKAVSLRMELKG
jgi:hypothetical protein